MPTVKMIVLISLLIASVTMDMYNYKIMNKPCALAIGISMTLAIFAEGANGLLQCLLGLTIPFILLFPLYMLNMMGAGDIKLFCAIGALVSINNILICIAYSFLTGFLIAVSLMFMRGNFRSRFKKLYLYLSNCFLSGSMMPYEKANAENDGRMHFSIPIALGTIAAFVIKI